jgi:hypothetical protein
MGNDSAVKYRRIAKAVVEADRVTNKTRHYRNGRLLPAPQSVEIVQLVPAAPGYYLLYFDSDGAEMTDTWHESVASAMEQAKFEFGLLPTEWAANDEVT